MNLIESIEAQYRANPLHGVQFSIEPEAYKCDIEDVRFGDNTTELQHGDLYNWQDVLLHGEPIGFLEEVVSGKMFHPLTVSFYVHIPDDEMTEDLKKDPHYFEGEFDYMRFANLQDMIDYVINKQDRP